LFYSRAVHPTTLHALNDLIAAQTKDTQATVDAMVQLLSYLATHPNATIHCYGSNMVLHIHFDASYLIVSEAHSHASGHFFLSSHDPQKQPPQNNGLILNLAHILNNVMASPAEAEVGGLYVNAQEGAVLCHTLIELGHPQLPSPLQTDTTAHGIINGTCKQQQTVNVSH
jgi:hypothetical protein